MTSSTNHIIWSKQAFKALDAGNADKYFKYMDNPVTVKYHFSGNYTLAINYIIAGRYDDAQRVINSYKKNIITAFVRKTLNPYQNFCVVWVIHLRILLC